VQSYSASIEGFRMQEIARAKAHVLNALDHKLAQAIEPLPSMGPELAVTDGGESTDDQEVVESGPPQRTLQDVLGQSPPANASALHDSATAATEGPLRRTTLKDLYDQPAPLSPQRSQPGATGTGTEKCWYDVPAWEDPAKLHQEATESLIQWRRLLRG